jgi:hypothetical protein
VYKPLIRAEEGRGEVSVERIFLIALLLLQSIVKLYFLPGIFIANLFLFRHLREKPFFRKLYIFVEKLKLGEILLIMPIWIIDEGGIYLFRIYLNTRASH